MVENENPSNITPLNIENISSNDGVETAKNESDFAIKAEKTNAVVDALKIAFDKLVESEGAENDDADEISGMISRQKTKRDAFLWGDFVQKGSVVLPEGPITIKGSKPSDYAAAEVNILMKLRNNEYTNFSQESFDAALYRYTIALSKEETATQEAK